MERLRMKVAVSSQGEDLEAPVEPRFGRCKYFVVVDPKSWDFQAYLNEGAISGGGAGILAAQNVAKMGVKSVITGHVGPNAYQTLSASGIDILIGAYGKVKDMVELYNRGKLQKAESPSVADHFGRGGGMGRGRGRGMRK
jgi:predicted Fe-Mo cluster-binding NifX family protein